MGGEKHEHEATPPASDRGPRGGMASAVTYIRRLPYGRNTDRSDILRVLREGKGTCSTKHALLACLAQEQGIPLELTLP